MFGYECILNLFNQLLFTKYKGRWFIRIKKPKSFKNCFCYRSFFLKGSFVAKKLNMELEEISRLFLDGNLSSSFKGLLTFFKINYFFTMTQIYMFPQCSYTISYVIYD
jgi:hypothetical protein